MNELSLHQRIILDIIANEPLVDNIRQLSIKYDINYKSLNRIVNELLTDGYLKKTNNVYTINEEKPYSTVINKMINLKALNNYVQMIEKALIDNHFITDDELNALRNHLL